MIINVKNLYNMEKDKDFLIAKRYIENKIGRNKFKNVLVSLEKFLFDFESVVSLPGIGIPKFHIDFLEKYRDDKNFLIEDTDYYNLFLKSLSMNARKSKCKRFISLYNNIQNKGWNKKSCILLYKFDSYDIKKFNVNVFCNSDSDYIYHRFNGSHRTACCFVLSLNIPTKIFYLKYK